MSILIEWDSLGSILIKSGLHKNTGIILVRLDGIDIGTVWVNSHDSQINLVGNQWNSGI